MLERANELAKKETEERTKKLEEQVKEWQNKLEAFNTKVEKPEPKKIEIVPIDDDKKPEDVVSYTIKDLITTEFKEEVKDEVVKVEYKIEEEPKKKTDERLKPNLTEVIETESSLDKPQNAKPLVLRTIKPETKKQLPKDDFERRGMLNKLHQEHGKYKDVSDVELKQERDDFNRQRFLDAVAITEDDARNHPPITKGRMAFFEDYLDDILRGDTEAENLPPEIARTCAVLLSEYDNPAIVEPQPAGMPDRTIATVTTDGLM